MSNNETITMPIAVFNAAASLIEEFLSVDYEEQIKYFRRVAEDKNLSEEDRELYQQEADALEAAAKLFTGWRIAHASDAVTVESLQLSF